MNYDTTDPRLVCKYGNTCYQKNPQHHLKFKHPLSNEKKQNDCGGNEKATKKRKFQDESVQECSAKFSKASSEPNSRSPSPNISPVSSPKPTVSSPKKNLENKYVSKEKDIKEGKHQIAPFFSNPEAELPLDPSLSARENIKERFLVEMPEDFYNFFDFCKQIKEDDPLAALSSIGLSLVGPYDLLAGRSLQPATPSRFLCHWRFYYDPPELQTVLASSSNRRSNGTSNSSDGSNDSDIPPYHVGYFRDSPDDAPVFLASMGGTEPNKRGTVTPLAGNMFDAVRMFCQEGLTKADPFKKAAFTFLIKKLETGAKKWNYPLDTKAEVVKRRRSRVVCRTFHGAGLVVPYDKKTEVGYREVPETDASLRRMLQKVADAKTEDSRRLMFADVQELMTNAQWATDEGDCGMSLELGLALFLQGSTHLQTAAAHLMTVPYDLLGKQTFATILKAHLKNRRSGSDMSAFQQRRT